MRTFVTLALAALAAAFCMPTGASAQYYDPYGDGYYRRPPPPPPGYYRPRPEYGYPPRPDYGYPPPGYGRARLGTICVTSRGNCSVGRPIPIQSPCGCYIPGFGQKRGAVGY